MFFIVCLRRLFWVGYDQYNLFCLLSNVLHDNIRAHLVRRKGCIFFQEFVVLFVFIVCSTNEYHIKQVQFPVS